MRSIKKEFLWNSFIYFLGFISPDGWCSQGNWGCFSGMQGPKENYVRFFRASPPYPVQHGLRMSAQVGITRF
jgi:hypothetical protein